MKKKLDIIKKINNILPQLQCQKCGYQDCITYATAISKGENHNFCIPGEQKTIIKLSNLLNRKILHIKENIKYNFIEYVAQINQNICIGCKICLSKCPIDAIIGSRGMIHNIDQSSCTGCSLCLDSCPVNCIILTSRNQVEKFSLAANKKLYKRRYKSKQERLQNIKNKFIKLKNKFLPTKNLDFKSYLSSTLIKFKKNRKKYCIKNEKK